MEEFTTDVDKLLPSGSDGAISMLKRRARRHDGQGVFLIFFSLAKVSKSLLPETRMLTFKKISQMTNVNSKSVHDNINVLKSLGTFTLSYERFTTKRKEYVVIVKPHTEWKEGLVDEIVNIYNWGKDKW